MEKRGGIIRLNVSQKKRKSWNLNPWFRFQLEDQVRERVPYSDYEQ